MEWNEAECPSKEGVGVRLALVALLPLRLNPESEVESLQGGPELVAHHFAALAAVAAAAFRFHAHNYTLALLATECTTPFVNMRWLLDKGVRAGPATRAGPAGPAGPARPLWVGVEGAATYELCACLLCLRGAVLPMAGGATGVGGQACASHCFL